MTLMWLNSTREFISTNAEIKNLIKKYSADKKEAAAFTHELLFN